MALNQIRNDSKNNFAFKKVARWPFRVELKNEDKLWKTEKFLWLPQVKFEKFRQLNAQRECLLSHEICSQLMASESFETRLQWAQAISLWGKSQRLGLEELYFELMASWDAFFYKRKSVAKLKANQATKIFKWNSLFLKANIKVSFVALNQIRNDSKNHLRSKKMLAGRFELKKKTETNSEKWKVPLTSWGQIWEFSSAQRAE